MSSVVQKRYVVVSGWVRSRYDGDVHFIPAHRVAQLYKVNPLECHFCDAPESYRGLPDGLIVLGPDSTGKYQI